MTPEGLCVDERYRVVGRLGGGGMADVYDAVDVVTGRPVAVKVLRGVDSADAARRFAAEIRTTAKLAHPCIVALLDAGEHDGSPYLVMERIDGGSLLARLRNGPLTAEETARVGAQIAAALAHAHELGIVHRDVKPANVLLDPDGRARLADFGIAVSATATRLTVSGSVAGSAAYVSPEQVLGKDVGPGADVYALGLVLVECLLGRPVFSGTAVEAALARLTRDPDLPAGLPPAWARVLRAMTSRSPVARPDADAVAQAMAELATVDVPDLVPTVIDVDDEAPTITSLPVAQRARADRWGSRAVTLLGAAITSVLVAGVGALALPPRAADPAPPVTALSDVRASWARASIATAPATEVAAVDEERILRELRRWAAQQEPRTIVRTKVVKVEVDRRDDEPREQTAVSGGSPTAVDDAVADSVTPPAPSGDDTAVPLSIPEVTVPTTSDPVSSTTDTVDDTVDTVGSSKDKLDTTSKALLNRPKDVTDRLLRRDRD